MITHNVIVAGRRRPKTLGEIVQRTCIAYRANSQLAILFICLPRLVCTLLVRAAFFFSSFFFNFTSRLMHFVFVIFIERTSACVWLAGWLCVCTFQMQLFLFNYLNACEWQKSLAGRFRRPRELTMFCFLITAGCCSCVLLFQSFVCLCARGHQLRLKCCRSTVK